MLSKSNQFACFAEQEEDPEPNIFVSANKQLTVGELLVFLTKIINLNQNNAKLSLFGIEYGSLNALNTVELDEDQNIVTIT